MGKNFNRNNNNNGGFNFKGFNNGAWVPSNPFQKNTINKGIFSNDNTVSSEMEEWKRKQRDMQTSLEMSIKQRQLACEHPILDQRQSAKFMKPTGKKMGDYNIFQCQTCNKELITTDIKKEDIEFAKMIITSVIDQIKTSRYKNSKDFMNSPLGWSKFIATLDFLDRAYSSVTSINTDEEKYTSDEVDYNFEMQNTDDSFIEGMDDCQITGMDEDMRYNNMNSFNNGGWDIDDDGDQQIGDFFGESYNSSIEDQFINGFDNRSF